MDAAIAILTGVLVAVTAFYAWTTWRLVQSAEATRLDATLPVVSFQLSGGLDGQWQGKEAAYEQQLDVLNIGAGPALSVAYIWISGVTGSISVPSDAVGIGAGKSTAAHLHITPTPKEFLDSLATEREDERALWTAGVLVVTYVDVHRRSFHSAVSVDISSQDEGPGLTACLAEPSFGPGSSEATRREGKLLRFVATV